MITTDQSFIAALCLSLSVTSVLLIEGYCKTWTGTLGTLANSADPDQMLQNVASDQGLHCLLKLQEFKDQMKQSYVSFHDHFPSLHSDNRPTSAVSALIIFVYICTRSSIQKNMCSDKFALWHNYVNISMITVSD